MARIGHFITFLFIHSLSMRWFSRNNYSTIVTYKQNIFPKHGMTGSRYSKALTYCSKILLQVYYFGTGNKSVIQVFPSLVSVLWFTKLFYKNI